MDNITELGLVRYTTHIQESTKVTQGQIAGSDCLKLHKKSKISCSSKIYNQIPREF